MPLDPPHVTPADLDAALRRASSRLTPPPTPWRSTAIHGSALALWIALLAVAVLRLGGVVAWSVGAVYIAYDTLLQAFVLWQCRHLAASTRSPEARPAARHDARPRLCVIVAAYNESPVLEATLAALRAQDDPPDEILVADDGSTDGTAALFHARFRLEPPAEGDASPASAAMPSLRWLRVAHGGKARALNAALLHTGAEIVLTVDADTLLDPRAVGTVRRAFEGEPALAAVTGVITPVCARGLGGRVLEWFQTYEYIRNFLSRHAWMQVDGLLLISGAFAGFRRQALLRVGGFDAGCLVEDYELIHRMRRHAVRNGLVWRFRVLGGAQARTEAPSSIGAFLRQRRRWFGGFLQTQYWYRAMVGDGRHGRLGTWMLPVKAVDTLQPLYGIAAFVLLVVFAVRGDVGTVRAVGGLIGAKIVVDLAFHAWSVQAYRRWVGDGRPRLGWALLAAIAEPFTFQLLRHCGALLGWVAFLTGQRRWGRQRRHASMH